MMMVGAKNSGPFWGGIGRYRLAERFGGDQQYEAGLTVAGFYSPDYLGAGILGAMLQARTGDGNIYLPNFWFGVDAGMFLTGNAGNTAMFGGTVRWQSGTRIGLHAALRYMLPFTVRGKTEEYGGFSPELGVGFLWN